MSRAGADTRDALLDAAEQLFAERGYEGTSLRDIAGAASQNMALSTYHFGSKERLFEAVVQRRATAIEALRLAALAKVEVTTLSRQDAIRSLVEAYALPMIEACFGPSRQWRAYVRLMSQIAAIERWRPLIREYYDPCSSRFMEKFAEALPHADRRELQDAFGLMTATMLYVCSYSNRFDNLREQSLEEAEERSSATENFIRFAGAGFLAFAAPSDKRGK